MPNQSKTSAPFNSHSLNLAVCFLSAQQPPAREFAEKIQTAMPSNWYKLPPSSLHLSLLFLGMVPFSRLPLVEDALKEAGRRAKPRYHSYGSVDVFSPESKNNRRGKHIIYAKPDLGASFHSASLRALLTSSFRRRGIAIITNSPGSFKPHSTLARAPFSCREDVNNFLQNYGQMRSGRWSCDMLHLTAKRPYVPPNAQGPEEGKGNISPVKLMDRKRKDSNSPSSSALSPYVTVDTFKLGSSCQVPVSIDLRAAHGG